MDNSVLFYSKHFNIKQLADGVFAAINAEEGWAICNAGIIDLGDRTLVYDAFNTPQAASDLRKAAECLTGQPVRMVVNSHYHNDHIWGNQAFGADVDIISTAKTRRLILTEGAAEINWYRETAQERLAALEEEYAAAAEGARRQLKPLLFNYQANVAALPILRICLPNITFSGDVVFHGAKRSAKLISFEGGHCGSDTILHLPEDGIVFMEDILFIDCHPYLGDGEPDMVQCILAQVKELQPSIVVPGHGPIGTIEHLDVMDEYIEQLKKLISEAFDQEVSEEKLDQVPVPKEYQHFLFPMFFGLNLKFLYQRQAKAS